MDFVLSGVEEYCKSRNDGNALVGSSADDILQHIEVTDVRLALKAFALLKVAGYIPQDKFDMALELASGLG